jgi:predicted branched-subunit amino acid permease
MRRPNPAGAGRRGLDTLARVTRGWLQQIDRRAIADCLPLFLPAVPFGFVLGLAITEGQMPPLVGWLGSPIIFAGAAQLAVVTLAGTASLWSVVIAGFVINTRHVMYSAALAPTFQQQPRWMRWVGPYVLLDQVFALAVLQTHRPPDEFRRYYLSAGFFFALNWQWAVALGMVVGPSVPDSWRIEFAPAVMFLGLALISINRVPQAVAATVGGSVGLAAAGLPDRLGILVGAIAGVLAGAIAEYRVADEPAHELESVS